MSCTERWCGRKWRGFACVNSDRRRSGSRASVKRAVWARDDGQCSYAGNGGRRCEARGFLEFHHLTPYATGGSASVENITLRCRAHNEYEADRFFAPIRADMSAHHSTRPGTG